MFKYIKQTLVIGILMGGGIEAVSGQTLYLQYLFNGTGSTDTGGGSLAAGVTTYDGDASKTQTADLHSASGTGVSGAAGDEAFNNSLSTGMGSGGTGGRAETNSAVNLTLTSFTVTGWFETDGSTMIGSAAKLINYNANASSGFQIVSNNPGRLGLNVNVNGTSTTVQSGVTGSTEYGATQQWVFFAVTYDGTATTNNVDFYVGSATGAVTLVSTATLNDGTMANPASDFTIGNSVGTISRPFDGLMDDIRLYGATSGSSGAITDLSTLDQIRLNDLGAVPEPSTMAFLLGGVAVLGGGLFVRGKPRSATP